MRLTKFLQKSGIAARRKTEEMILSGQVSVDGKIIKKPQYQVADNSKVLVNGEPCDSFEEKYYFVINKPKGYVCTNTGGKRKVTDLFEDVDARLFTVGRLDKDTEGLLIVTNDGEFANQVIHPSANLSKEYVAKTDHEITDIHLKKISQGTRVEGTFVKPKKVQKIRRGTLRIVVGEGKKREVRLLLASAGLATIELKRTRLGGITLGTLPVGAFRPLGKKERQQIFC